MRVRLAYGREGLEVDLPETPGFAGVLRGSEAPALPDPAGALDRALREPIASGPLADVICAKTASLGRPATACVVISDITRPVPNRLLLPPILETLERGGIARENITILIGTGIHRPNEGEELELLVGPEVAATHRVVNHRSRCREEMADCGRTSTGIPVILNRLYVEADVKILTGFIEPHMWAGYSGGRKAILPGVASFETMRHMHGPAMVADRRTTPGLLDGNPFHEAGLEVLRMVGADFIVNVTLDREKRVTGVWAGDPVEAHLAGCRFLERHCVAELSEPLDFAVTTNAGYPLDCSLYQSVKGVTAAAQAVREGGAILIATACFEGVGSREFQQMLESIASPREFLDHLARPDQEVVVDQWCAQEMCQVMLAHEVLIRCQGIEPRWLRARGLTPVDDVGQAVSGLLSRFGPQARWAVIPEGPLTIVRVATSFTCEEG